VDPVVLDAQQIGRVLSNLLSNALLHTPPGGAVQIHAFRVIEGVAVEVSDSGQGIDSRDLPHIFERFYRGEKSRNRTTGGAGLGLAIAKGIVEAHGGRISAESSPNDGTCFRFVLPAKAR
jgi:signal transduction histidine kinase